MGNAKLKDEFDDKDAFADELEAGSTLMHGQYTIERFLNAGGFGITYAARDSLDRRVVIKECFPGAFCRRSKALVTARSRAHQSELGSIVRLFVQEARSLAKLNHPNIVGVHQVFEENNTAYMALDFVEGRDLLDIIEDPEDGLEPDEIKSILRKVLEAVNFIHDQGILHRDISPDNILLDENKSPVLIDFGAAREQATKQSRVLSALRVVKDGYSPQEFYIAGSEQGPYSDLYALGASFYHLLTDDLPPNSQARLSSVASGESDNYVPLKGRIKGYDENFLGAIDKSLAILPKDRIGSANDWIAMIDGRSVTGGPATGSAAKKPAAKPEVVAGPVGPKSGKGMLLATAAVVGLVAIGVTTQTNILGGDEPAVETASASEAAIEQETTAETDVESLLLGAASSEASEPVETSASNEIDTSAIVLTQEEPSVVAADEESLVVADAIVVEPAETAEDQTTVAEAPVLTATPELETPSTPAEPEVAVSEQPADAVEAPVVETAEATPVIPEPAPLPEIAYADLSAADVQVEAPALTDVAVEEATGLDTVASASAPVRAGVLDVAPLVSEGSADLPTIVSTALPPVEAQLVAPNLVTFGPAVTTTELPNRVDPFARPPVKRFIPETPLIPGEVVVASIDTTPAALPETKGVQVAGIENDWSVSLPNGVGFEGDQNAITNVFSVNEVQVTNLDEFKAAVRSSAGKPRGETVEVTVNTGVSSDTARETVWSLPVVEITRLSNGLVFEAAPEDGSWVTRVIEAPASLNLDMEKGDVMFGYLASSELLSERTALGDILAREIAQGQTLFNFAIKRGETTWAVAFPFDGAATQ